MLLLGIDIGTSFIKLSVVNTETAECIASASYPETEREIISKRAGWAEQSPEQWWEDVKSAILSMHGQKKYNPKDIVAIGIAYQMHGLVLVDKNKNILRNSIIWCDSRAVSIGAKAFEIIGKEKCLQQLLNSPGNFTASKLAWVKMNEPKVFEKISHILFPGDYIAMKLTGEISTTIPALSEGIFWDFRNKTISNELVSYFGIDPSLFPAIKNVFSVHGLLSREIANKLSLTEGIPVSYKSGDQPNNALSLNVLRPGEVAATAGTSGVIYSVTSELVYDTLSRINSFAHVNYTISHPSIGALLCINGAGHSYAKARSEWAPGLSYSHLNELAATVKPGADYLQVLPFGNGAERMFENKTTSFSLVNFNKTRHGAAHIFRAVQEGVAFAFRYGLDIMTENKMKPSVVRAGKSNMFLSKVFTACFVEASGIPLQLYKTDGSTGAALGAGIGAGIFKDELEAFGNLKTVETVTPSGNNQYWELYENWKKTLLNQLNK